MKQVQRWTGVVSANDNGGFVAYGDYLELQAKNERLNVRWDRSVTLNMALQTEVDKATKALNVVLEIDSLRAEVERLKSEAEFAGIQKLNDQAAFVHIREQRDQLRAQLEALQGKGQQS